MKVERTINARLVHAVILFIYLIYDRTDRMFNILFEYTYNYSSVIHNRTRRTQNSNIRQISYAARKGHNDDNYGLSIIRNIQSTFSRRVIFIRYRERALQCIKTFSSLTCVYFFLLFIWHFCLLSLALLCSFCA